MKSNIYLKLENFFNEPIIDIAKKLGYSENNIIILENNENKLKEKYLDTYSNLKSCYHNRDGRTEMQYAQDLICSWIFEDYLVYNLKLLGINLSLDGTDFERKILKSQKISSTSDYKIEYDNKKIYIELISDYKGYWNKNKKCDLRDDKYLKLKSLASDNTSSMLLGIDFYNKKFFFFNVNDDKNKAEYVSFHFAYKKPVYSIDLRQVAYYDFSFEKIVEVLKQYMEGFRNE